MAERFDLGCVAGYENDPNKVPAFFRKPFIELLPYERGYVLGRQVRLSETGRY